MNANPFRRRPYIELGIDSWKVIFLALGFLLLVLWLLLH
jgi:hypothetical protein